MRILQINQSDISGGAAIAGYRLHKGLLSYGVESRLLVGKPSVNNDLIKALPRKRKLEYLLYFFTINLGFNQIHNLGSFKINRQSFYQEADLLNFHNLHAGGFNYLAIPSLTQEKPAVYTLHDMWSFTGHCAYSYDCNRWKIGCGSCPYPHTYPAVKRDSTQLEWKLKNWLYSHSNLTIVTPSQWLAEQARQSMLNRFQIYCIPYGIDTKAYQPLERQICRSVLGIPASKKVLMFGAKSFKNSRKGSDLLLKALSSLPDSLKKETVLLTIGSRSEEIPESCSIPAINLGYLENERLQSLAYSAADLFLFPTRADNLPLVLQESMACGTPMISFDIGGVSDLVRPEVTGYLAKPEDAQDFCDGIVELLEDWATRRRMEQNCRAIAVKEYSLELQAKRYINLYQQVLDRKTSIL